MSQRPPKPDPDALRLSRHAKNRKRWRRIPDEAIAETVRTPDVAWCDLPDPSRDRQRALVYVKTHLVDGSPRLIKVVTAFDDPSYVMSVVARKA